MGLSAKQAAEQVGISKHGIIKAIREGRVSANKSKSGQWIIEPSELFRVYTPINKVNAHHDAEKSTSVNNGSHLENIRLKEKLEAAEKEILSLRADKEDYKERLDKEAEERRKLTMLLTDMRDKSPEKPVERPKRFLGIFSRQS